MKRAVRAIIIKDDNILVMRRDKFGKQYFILIGGQIHLGESLEHALLREIHLETMVRTANHRLVYIEHAEAPYGDQYVYLCDYISGVPVLHPEAGERLINAGGDNTYTPLWMPLSQLKNVAFRSEKLKRKILRHTQQGFPTNVQEFSSTID